MKREIVNLQPEKGLILTNQYRERLVSKYLRMIEQEELLQIYYKELWIFLGLCIFFTILIAVLVLLRNIYLKNAPNLRLSKSVYYGNIALLFVFNVLVMLRSYVYIEDLNHVINRDFLTIEGEVVGYTPGELIGDILRDDCCYDSIIVMEGTGERLVLKVFGTELHEHYTFLYLPNTKIAVIVDDD